MNFGLKDEVGTFRMVDKYVLSVDESYQRNVSEKRTKEFSSSWSWIACGTIIVANRNGKLFVVDGQHRVIAARQNESISNLPCLIFETDGNKQEAHAFLKTNTNRRPMSMFDRFNALIVSEDENALFCKDLMAQLGLELKRTVNSGSLPQHFKAVGWVLKQSLVSRSNTELAMKSAYEVAVLYGDNISKILLEGLIHIVINMSKDKLSKLIKRLKVVGHASIFKEMNKCKTLSGEGGRLVYCTGILNAANKGLKIKFKLDTKHGQLLGT